ncbi:DUF805 domain-containing protein [Hahella ganghwensis]|uniref:DUF805 domain-containing protein n=1 Tax=Hahella ganghwensis TaxID=286420 RepID=UPI00035F8F37|nr:DUF805 domain-containing protein [Hahella ganghwensis]
MENVYKAPDANLDSGNITYAKLTIMQILFSFTGRIGRKTYWLTALGMTVGMMVIAFILGFILAVMGVDEQAMNILFLVLYIPIIWISLALQVKRWHDRDKSGWWFLINFIPVIGFIWALVENGFLPGDTGANRFGMPSA